MYKYLFALLASISLYSQESHSIEDSPKPYEEYSYIAIGSMIPRIYKSYDQMYRGTTIAIGSRVWNDYFGVDSRGEYIFHPCYSSLAGSIKLFAIPVQLKGLYLGVGFNYGHIILAGKEPFASRKTHGNFHDYLAVLGHQFKHNNTYRFIELAVTKEKNLIIVSGLGF